MTFWGRSGGRKRDFLATSAIAVMAASHAGAALAQAAPQGPGGIAPTREELRPAPTQPADQTPRLSIAGDIERSPCPLADPRYADVKVTISSVVFNNLKGATAEEMRAAWAPFAGTAQPVAAICEIRDAAATILRNKGYLAAVQVPTQRIENGEVRLEVLYARVTAIRARGETKGAEKLIAAYLGKLTQDEIFDRNRAERYLLLVRDLPGYNVQLVLKPAGTAPGDLIGEVIVLKRPYAVDFTVQNLASRDTGPWGGQIRAQVFGLTGMGDATSISLYSTSDFDEQQILQVGHELRLGGNGLTLAGQFTYAWTSPDLGANAGPVDLEARTLFASLEARYPLLRRQARNVSISGGFDFVDQSVDFIGPLSRDRLRVGWVRLEGDAIDLDARLPRWRMSGSVEFRQGLSIFDATDGCKGGCPAGRTPASRNDGDADGSVLRASATGELALGMDVSFALTPRVQYGFGPLLSFEEFSAGNYTIGRGYDPGTIIGDSGAAFSAELRGPRFDVRRGSDATVQPYLFTDAAWVWNRNTPGNPQRLLSVGGGFRAQLSDRLRLDATFAVPTMAAGFQNKVGEPRFLISLTSRLLPWRTR